MNPHGTHFGGDSDALQADVMRFMAIIAFCLIAILALVRNVEPDATASPQPPPAEPMRIDPIPDPVPVAVPVELVELVELVEPIEPVEPVEPVEPIRPVVEKTIVVTRKPQPAPVQIPDPDPVPPAPSQPESSQPEVAEVQEPAPAPPQPEMDPDPVIQPDPQTSQAAATTADEGLSLRFASDGDFLRLIARGDITVYAFSPNDVLSLDESYRFFDAPAPGQIYELMLDTIPNLVVNALQSSRPNTDQFNWGISLPVRVSDQIQGHLASGSNGQLIIDRYGDVHHVPSS